MVRKPDIEYIDKFYSYGSAAKVIEFAPNHQKNETTMPKAVREKKVCIEVDPLALCGIVVAVVMILVMGIGLMDFKTSVEENKAVAEWLDDVRDEHVMLEYQYHQSYNVEEVEETVRALGMVRAENVPVVALTVTVPQRTQEYTRWGDFLWSLSCLFRA